jgi:hypothetical protein
MSPLWGVYVYYALRLTAFHLFAEDFASPARPPGRVTLFRRIIPLPCKGLRQILVQ